MLETSGLGEALGPLGPDMVPFVVAFTSQSGDGATLTGTPCSLPAGMGLSHVQGSSQVDSRLVT